MEKKRIYLSSPTMHGEEQAFINEAFATNWVAPLGPNVNALEQEMTAYMGGGHACALSAGTAAIHLALRILGIGQGDVVFAPSLTFDATCNPIVYEKGTPVFIDSEKDTWNMDPEALRKGKYFGKVLFFFHAGVAFAFISCSYLGLKGSWVGIIFAVTAISYCYAIEKEPAKSAEAVLCQAVSGHKLS